MLGKIKADGHRWEATLARGEPHPGVRAIVFHCVSDGQRGYRVVEVPAAEVEGGVLEGGEATLRALYDRSQPFGYAHDAKAHEDHIGSEPEPR